MSRIEDLDKVIRFEVTVQEDREIPELWKVTVTLLTNVPPVTAAGLVDQPIETRVIRPARPGDE